MASRGSGAKVADHTVACVIVIGLVVAQVMIAFAFVLTAPGNCFDKPDDPYMCRQDWAWPLWLGTFVAVLIAIDLVVLRGLRRARQAGTARWPWPVAGAAATAAAVVLAIAVLTRAAG